MKIVVTGSIAHDYIMKVNDKFSNYILPDQIEKLNVSFVVSDMKKSIGGVATNISYNLGLFGLKDQTIMLGSVGNDFQVDEKLSQIIDFGNIYKDENDLTACAYLISDSTGNQIIPFYPGAMSKASNQSISELEDIKYLIASPNDKFAIFKFLKQSKEKNIKCFFHPGQTTSIITKDEMIECFDNSDYLVCNDYEFDLIVKITGLEKEKIIGNFEKVVITLGKDGLDFYDSGKLIHLDVDKVDSFVDSTGAGDTLIGGLIAGLYNNNSRLDSLKIGLACTFYCITKMGTLNHSFTKEEIKSRVLEKYGINVIL